MITMTIIIIHTSARQRMTAIMTNGHSGINLVHDVKTELSGDRQA